MQITPDQLFGEAGRMALELRLKDLALESLSAELAALREQVAAANGSQEEHSHG